MESTDKNHRIFGLDFMRATAIIMVVFSHIGWIYPQKNNIVHMLMSFFGFWGVEIFFVLSGFLIGNILYNIYVEKDFSLSIVFNFLKRRWFRTLPNYFLILLINIGIAKIVGYNIIGLGRYFLFLQNFTHTMLPFFTESWSLSVEEFTYLLVPVVLLFVSFFVKQTPYVFLKVVLLFILMSLIAKIIYHYNTTNVNIIQWNVSLKAVVIYRIDAVLYGFLALWMSREYNQLWIKYKFESAFLGLTLMLLFNLAISYFKITIQKEPFFWNVIYLPINSIVFALFLPLLSQWEFSKGYFAKIITFISIISYSIYLLHYSVVLQLMKHFIDTNALSNTKLHFFTFFYLIITLFFSWLLYRFFEKPIMNLRNKH